MNITILSASPRVQSNTLRFAKAVASHIEKQGHKATLINFLESDIPLPNQGEINWENPTEFQQKLIQSLEVSSLVFVCTPEYNWLPSAEIINFINRFADKTRTPLFDNKIFALAGISSGRGGRLPMVILSTSLNKIIGFMGLNSFVSGKMFEAQFVPQVISSEGKLLDNTAFNTGFIDFVDYSLKVAGKQSNKIMEQ